MDKTTLIEKVSQKTGTPKSEVKKVINTMADTIQEALIFGMDVKIPMFAHFELKVSPEMVKTHPQDPNRKITIPKRYRVKVSLPKKFNDRIREKTVY